MTASARNHVALIAAHAPGAMVTRTVRLTPAAAARLDVLARGDDALTDQLLADLLEDHLFSDAFTAKPLGSSC